MLTIIKKIKHETSVLTFIQFILMSTLYFAINLRSIIGTCVNGSNECLSNMISSLTLSILVVIVFSCIWIIGYFVQTFRSHKLALLLILIESGIFIVEFFDSYHHSSLLSLLTSIIDVLLAFWIITLAIRVYRAKGARIVVISKVKKKRNNL